MFDYFTLGERRCEKDPQVVECTHYLGQLFDDLFEKPIYFDEPYIIT